jgi:transglutaminase-like putative cysteine protease
VLAALRPFLSALVVSIVVSSAANAFADTWTKPTSEELQMTAEPEAPGAAAIYLLRDERADDKLHVHITYVRLKVLTEKGKEYADQEISYEGAQFKIFGVEGRTIHSDGTVIPFSGKPYQKVLEKGGKEKYKATVFTLPDVQVGSILEYRYVLSYDNNLVVSPRWYLQGPLYIRKAHYQFVPSEHELQDGHGGVVQGRVAYASFLPQGASIAYSPAGKFYTLDVEKIPAFPEEEFMPPLHNYTFRALFYYTIARNADEYWANEGKYWSKNVDRFIDAGKLSAVVSQIVAPADTPEQKLKKIYAAVMKLENTSFTREHTGAEDKAEGIKVRTAADVWEQKRGNRDELTQLFVGLARAAGVKAYVGIVTNRDRNLFVADYLDMSQLDDDIAIVNIDGKDQLFDPGERYAEYGQLHWKHTITQGIRQTDKGAAIFSTPIPGYQSSTQMRFAYLEIQPDGKVSGSIRYTLTGNRALRWREFALRNDEDALKEQFEQMVQREVPPGIDVKVGHFLGLNDFDTNLMCMLKVTGSMGTATAKRVFLPGTFFEANSHPLFALDKRTMPIDLDYPEARRDTVSIKLPAAWEIESLPTDAEFTFPQNALYQAKFTRDPGEVKSSRLLVVGNSIFKPEDYTQLKDFYQKVNAKDKEPAVLELKQSASTAGGGPAGKAQ